jgi:hypothetical protein
MKLTTYKNTRKSLDFFLRFQCPENLDCSHMIFLPFTDYYILISYTRTIGNLGYSSPTEYGIGFGDGNVIPIECKKENLFETLTIDYSEIEAYTKLNLYNLMDIQEINFAYVFQQFSCSENVIKKFEAKYWNRSEYNKEFNYDLYNEMKSKFAEYSDTVGEIHDFEQYKKLVEQYDKDPKYTFPGYFHKEKECPLTDVEDNDPDRVDYDEIELDMHLPEDDRPFIWVDDCFHHIFEDHDLENKYSQEIMDYMKNAINGPRGDLISEKEYQQDLELEKEGKEIDMEMTKIDKPNIGMVYSEKREKTLEKIMAKYSSVDNVQDLFMIVQEECIYNIAKETGVDQFHWNWKIDKMFYDMKYRVFHERAEQYLKEAD